MCEVVQTELVAVFQYFHIHVLSHDTVLKINAAQFGRTRQSKLTMFEIFGHLQAFHLLYFDLFS